MALTTIKTASLPDDAITAAKIADESVDEARVQISNAGTNGQYLQKQSGNTGGLTWADVPAGVGGATGADFNDNVKIRLGTGNDLELFHDGSNSRVREAGTGNLRLEGTVVELWGDGSKQLNTFANGIQVTGISSTGGIDVTADNAKVRLGASQDLQLYHDGSSNVIETTANTKIGKSGEASAWFNPDGNVQLYYDNSKKFETLSSGAKVTGALTVTGNIHAEGHVQLGDSDYIKIGAGDDLQIYHNGSNSYIDDSGTGALIFKSNTYSFRNAADNEQIATFNENGAVELYYDNSKKFETTTNGVKVKMFDDGGDSQLFVEGGEGRSAEIYIYADDGDDAADKWRICNTANDAYMQIQNYGAGSWQNNIRFEERGGVEMYYANTKVFALNEYGAECYYSHGQMQFRAGSGTDDDVFIKDGSLNFDSVNNANSLGWIALYGHLGGTTQFRDVKIGHGKGGGYCTFDGSAETITGDFNDTSDERLKKDIVSIGDEGLTKIKQLRPVSFKWRNTDRNSYGFIAQEVETVLPHAVETTITDDADFAIEDANAKARGAVAVQDLKALNTNSLVAYLAKAVQELSAEVDTLKTKVAALEAA